MRCIIDLHNRLLSPGTAGASTGPSSRSGAGVAQAQPRLEVHEAHVEVHALAHQGAALLCEEEEFGSAPDASSSVEDDDE